MKATAIAPANIAFIKYWGKINEKLRLPAHSSISMNLDKCTTTTTVEFNPEYKSDSFQIIGEKITKKETQRVNRHLDKIRNLAKINLKAKVLSYNSFPKSSGVASSASGFAALTLAAAKAVNLNLSQKQLSILARLGSGSAARSIPDGFCQWKKGNSSQTSYAYSLYPLQHWNLRDILLLVSKKPKKVSSTKGQKISRKTSPFYKTWVEKNLSLIKKTKQALKNKDLKKLGEVIEKDCLNLHAITLTSRPALVYWTDTTLKIIHQVYSWREKGLPVYFTIDSGPNVHLICLAKDAKIVYNKAKNIKGIKKIIINKPAHGAKLINNHLF